MRVCQYSTRRMHGLPLSYLLHTKHRASRRCPHLPSPPDRKETQSGLDCGHREDTVESLKDGLTQHLQVYNKQNGTGNQRNVGHESTDWTMVSSWSLDLSDPLWCSPQMTNFRQTIGSESACSGRRDDIPRPQTATLISDNFRDPSLFST